jgi:uncharacterized membrane protein
MNGILRGIVLSILPVSELRGGIPVAIGSGVEWPVAFAVCVLANMIVVPPLFFFLDYIHEHFMKIAVYRRLFELYIDRLRKKAEENIKTWEYLALYLFVAVPMAGTGAYTGCLVSWFFRLERKKSYVAIALGVLSAGVVVTLVTQGFLSIQSLFSD